MIHEDLEFHNIAELVKVDGFGGLRLQRAPESLRPRLNEGAAGVLLSPADCEIRFRIAEGRESATIRLSSESKTTVYLYFGSSGCCLCERPLTDFLAEQACDLVTLEISVNMVGSHTVDEFRERAGYLVERLADSEPDRPVVCLTVLPHFRDIDDSFSSPDAKSTAEEFREALRAIVKNLARPNVSLIEGSDLVPDIGVLSFDLIHPGARGMIQIGEELARRIRKIV